MNGLRYRERFLWPELDGSDLDNVHKLIFSKFFSGITQTKCTIHRELSEFTFKVSIKEAIETGSDNVETKRW